MMWMLTGCVMSCSIEVAVVILFSSVRLGVRTPIILAAVLVMCLSLVQVLTDSMLKKQVEQCSG